VDGASSKIEFDTETDEAGEVSYARVRFGPHYLLEVRCEQGRTSLELCFTHHGFRADASELDGELEGVINEVRRRFPELVVD
jgi:hypothetical protein